MEAHSNITNQMNMNETFSDAVYAATAREIAPGHAGFTMNADGTTTRQSANGQTSTPVNATVSITDTTTSSAQALDFLPVLPAKPTSSAAIFTAFEGLAQARLNWEANQQRASNEVLYAILDRCYDIFDLTQKADDLRKKFLEAYAEKHPNTKAGTSIATKIIWAVFGKSLEQRAATYSRVLRLARMEILKEPKLTFRQFLARFGGIEEVRRHGNGEEIKRKRDTKIQSATAKLMAAKGLAGKISMQLPSDMQEKNEGHSFRAALLREEADGTHTVVMVSVSQGTVATMLGEFENRSADPAASANSAPASVSDVDALADIIAANAIV